MNGQGDTDLVVAWEQYRDSALCLGVPEQETQCHRSCRDRGWCDIPSLILLALPRDGLANSGEDRTSLWRSLIRGVGVQARCSF